MPGKPRTITIEIDPNVSPDQYAQIANAVWSLINLTNGKPAIKVRQDHLATGTELNNWYEQAGRDMRWT